MKLSFLIAIVLSLALLGRAPAVHAQAEAGAGSRMYAPLPRPALAQQRLEDNLEAARAAQAADPSETNTIWVGRRLAYLNRYEEAIEIYTQGLKRYPQSYRLLRHRGHRYISTRQFDLALQDFEAAYAAMPKGVTHIEADGIPNRLNTPLSNTQFNILYHWGLAHYLQGDFLRAAQRYRECLDYSPNDDLQVATRDWLWMALRRAGGADAKREAEQVLAPVDDSMTIVENDAYLKRLLLYKGVLSPAALLRTEAADASLALATQGYGVANWHFVHGRWWQAREMLNGVLASGNWPAFGYIAAEADRARGVPDFAAAAAMLDGLHAAAAVGDWDGYFSLYHPSARFLGTDATEDWDMPTFKAYAGATQGWTYHVRDRALYQPTDGVVMFHELLDNAKYGTSRGSGALVWDDGGLYITQYHLTFPIPNALAEEFTRRIRIHESEGE